MRTWSQGYFDRCRIVYFNFYFDLRFYRFHRSLPRTLGVLLQHLDRPGRHPDLFLFRSVHDISDSLPLPPSLSVLPQYFQFHPRLPRPLIVSVGVLRHQRGEGDPLVSGPRSSTLLCSRHYSVSNPSPPSRSPGYSIRFDLCNPWVILNVDSKLKITLNYC